MTGIIMFAFVIGMTNVWGFDLARLMPPDSELPPKVQRKVIGESERLIRPKWHWNNPRFFKTHERFKDVHPRLSSLLPFEDTRQAMFLEFRDASDTNLDVTVVQLKDAETAKRWHEIVATHGLFKVPESPFELEFPVMVTVRGPYLLWLKYSQSTRFSFGALMQKWQMKVGTSKGRESRRGQL
jgi:hypothetical protein